MAIASAAHVAPDTVYAIFGTKARILTALIDHELAPSEDTSTVTDRPEAHAVRDELDQRKQIHLFARDIAAVVQRVRPIHEILQTAAAVDPNMLAISTEMENYRLTEIRKVAAWLALRGPLRVEPEHAAEIIWALASPNLSRMLCETRQWSLDQYSAWLEDTLARTLLD
jgi:AcrR family transcriptional regulator